MSSAEINQPVPTYMAEYRRAFSAVPFTSEHNGVITDMHTGNVVEIRATDEGYRERYGQFMGGQAVQQAFNRTGEV